MKKHISILLILTFLISVFSVGTVFAYDAETTVDDTFVENVVIKDYVTNGTASNCDLVIDGNAMTFSPKSGSTGTTNIQYTDNVEGKNWLNTGLVEITYTVSYSGTLVSGDKFGMGIALTAFNGSSRAWILGGVKSFEGFSFEDGATRNIKHMVEFTDTQTIVNSYVKSPEDDEWTYAFTVTNEFAANTDKRHFRELLPFSQFNFAKGTTDVSATISDVKVVEKYKEPMMTKIGGNYLALDSIDVSYFIPEGYKSAKLTFNGETVKEFDSETEAYGSYRTSFGLSQFDVIAENIPLKLEVTGEDDSFMEAAEYITVTEPILEPSFEDVSGEYTTAKTVTVNFELPHVYNTAELTYNGEVVASYNSDENGGGPYSADIVLGDYGYVGENLPIVLTVTYDDKDDDVYNSVITVTESFPNAEFGDVSGVYVMYDTITAKYILPDDYISAKLTFNGEVIAEHENDSDKSGRYTAELSLADFEAVGNDIPLTLTVTSESKDEEEFTSDIDVVEIMNVNEILFEDFEDESYTMTNDVNADFTPEQINSVTFGSKVYQHEFTTTSFARTQIIKRGLAIDSGLCLDVSWDVNVSSTKFVGGLHGKKDSSNWYTAQRFQKDGLFLGIKEYETDKWYNVLYRIFPGSATESGKHEIHLYVDGEYVASTETVYTDGFYQLAVDYENGYSLGKMYVDNIRMVSYSPMYDVVLTSADGNEEIDYNAPSIKAVFDQKMAADSISSDNIKLIGFNDAEVSCTLTYDDATNTLTVVPEGKLVPGKQYTLKISGDVATLYGAYYKQGTEISINTKKAAFSIETLTVDDINAGSEFDATVALSNTSGEAKAAKVFVALFADGKLESISSADASGEYLTKDITLTLKAPVSIEGDVKVCAYLVNGTDTFAVIDWTEK